MKIVRPPRLELADILRAANKRYPDNYLSEYFDEVTGGRRSGAGDVLACFIVSELRETFDGKHARDGRVSEAIGVLERAKIDIQAAIDGLRELSVSTTDLKRRTGRNRGTFSARSRLGTFDHL